MMQSEARAKHSQGSPAVPLHQTPEESKMKNLILCWMFLASLLAGGGSFSVPNSADLCAIDSIGNSRAGALTTYNCWQCGAGYTCPSGRSCAGVICVRPEGTNCVSDATGTSVGSGCSGNGLYNGCFLQLTSACTVNSTACGVFETTTCSQITCSCEKNTFGACKNTCL